METYNSQDFADYFNECRYVDDKEKSDDSLDEESKNEDFSGQLEWFEKVGVNTAAINVEDEKDVEEDQLGDVFLSLTHRQAAVVRQKIATYKATVRKSKKSKSRIPDVRDVFPQNPSESSSSGTRSRSATPNSLDSLSPSEETFPGFPDWDSQPVSSSQSVSQGYYSRTSIHETTSQFTLNISVNHWKAPRVHRLSNGSTGRSPPSETDWEKVRTPPDGSATISYDTTLDNHGKTSPTDAVDFPFLKSHRNKYNQIAKDENLKGIQIRSYQNIGSYYGGAKGLNINLSSPLEVPESYSCFDPREDQEQPEWDFEQRSSDTVGDDLPVFYCVPDKIGKTIISDLSTEDVMKIRPLALLEFTILGEPYGIQCHRRKSPRKRRKEENSVFGVPLITLLEHDRKLLPDCKIPLVMERLLNRLDQSGLKEEGILRIPGSSHKTDLLKMELDHNFYLNPASVDRAFQKCSTNDVIAVLKYFIRQLPNPLFTNDYIEVFLQLGKITDAKDQLKILKLLILQLPEAHRNVLKALLIFLSKVAENEKYNRMSLQNIAMIMAPNLFLPKNMSRDAKKDLATEMIFAETTGQLTKLMIKYQDILFTVPGFMLKQIRVQYETSIIRKNAKENNKPMKWLLAKKPAKAEIYRKINNEVDFQEGIIRVQAFQFHPERFAVQLTSTTTAGDVVGHILKYSDNKTPPRDRQRVQGRMETRRALSELTPNNTNVCLMNTSFELALNSHYIHEVGGNIGDRLIHHETSMMAVYQENPNAEWIIKCHHLGSFMNATKRSDYS